MPINVAAAIALLSLCLASNALAQESPSKAHDHASQAPPTALMNVTPQAFATQATVMGEAEVELAQLALQKTQNADVRTYAQRMLKDHTAANANLRQLAVQQNITLPSALDTDHQAVKQKLMALQGNEFDREYEREMAKGHDKAVALFQSAVQSPQMPEDFKRYAAATLSTLEDHREQAQQLVSKGGG
jgi:putative membrane protein